MKITYIVLFICLLNSTTLKKSNKIEYDLTFSEEEAKSIANKLIDLECAKTPLKYTCPNCIKGEDGNTFLHYYSLIRHKKFHYKFLIQFNDEKQKIYIYFNSPIFNKKNYLYFKKYFIKKIPVTDLNDSRISVEILYLYQKYFQPKLYSSLERLLNSNRGKFTFVFAGNSLAGSLATFAAYDISKNYQNLEHKNIEVYSFNSLIISDNKFANEINLSNIKVHRIYKEDDFLIYPNCTFDKIKSIWLCKNEQLEFINKPYELKKKDRSDNSNRSNRSNPEETNSKGSDDNNNDNNENNDNFENNHIKKANEKINAEEAKKNVIKELNDIKEKLRIAKKDYNIAIKKAKKDPKDNRLVEEALDNIRESKLKMRKVRILIENYRKTIQDSQKDFISDSQLDEELDEEKEEEKEKNYNSNEDFLSYALNAINVLKKATKIIKKKKTANAKKELVNDALNALEELSMASKNYEKEKKIAKVEEKKHTDLVNNAISAVDGLKITTKIVERKKYIKIKDDTPLDQENNNDHKGFIPAFIPKSKRKLITFKVEKYGNIYLYDPEMENYKVCETKSNDCIIKIKPFSLITKYSNSVLFDRQLGLCNNK